MSTHYDRDHDDRRPRMPWTFPFVAGTAIVLVLLMALAERSLN
ncbi:hypothetical protein [Falsiroseomonas sp. CW058]